MTLSASVKSAQRAFAKRTLQTVYPSTEYCYTARMLSDMWFYLLVSVVISKRLRSTEKDAVVAQVNREAVSLLFSLLVAAFPWHWLTITLLNSLIYQQRFFCVFVLSRLNKFKEAGYRNKGPIHFWRET